MKEEWEKVLADFKPYYRVDYEIAEAVFESYNLQKDTYLKTLLNILILRKVHLLIIILLIKTRVKIFFTITHK